jgi:hypothetical protein
MIRLVLAERVTSDDLDDLAVQAGFLLLNLVPAADTHPAQAIYRTRDRRALVHVIDDARAASLIVVVQGPGEVDVAATVREGVLVTTEEVVVA